MKKLWFLLFILILIPCPTRAAADTGVAEPTLPILTVEFLDVGQGDAALVTISSGKHYLIDAGPDPRQVADLLHARGITHLEGMVLSHPHADHIVGAEAVLKELTVGVLYDPGYPHTGWIYRAVLTAALERNVPYVNPVAGDTLEWDTALAVTVLHPDTPTYRNLNENSIVMRLAYGNFSVLFTGDAGFPAERKILAAFDTELLRSTVLKVGHHGSKNSTSNEFLDAVQPWAAVISCKANNSYGHPKQQVLDRLLAHHVVIDRIDQCGSVTITTEGHGFYIRSSDGSETAVLP